MLGEDRVTTVSEDGSVTGSYSLGRNYLKGCSFGGDGFAVLLLSRYRRAPLARRWWWDRMERRPRL